jgi:peroxiredoxin
MALQTGDLAPPFSLPNANDASGSPQMSFDDVELANGTLVVFECNHCPYVVASIDRMNAMAIKCKELGIGYVGINSNDPVVYENDSYENMVKRAKNGMPYPYLHDESQEIAHAYGAKRTPEFFLFNSQRCLVYQGRMDDSPRHPGEVTTTELDDAITAMMAGQVPEVTYTESIGCSVKWKA